MVIKKHRMFERERKIKENISILDWIGRGSEVSDSSKSKNKMRKK